MAMPLRLRVPEGVGAWLAVPKTQRNALNNWIISAVDLAVFNKKQPSF